MSTSPLPPPERKPVSLAKLATIFAVVFVLAFGLCTCSVALDAKITGFFVGASLVIEAICAIGLIIVGITAFIRSIRS